MLWLTCNYKYFTYIFNLLNISITNKDSGYMSACIDF